MPCPPETQRLLVLAAADSSGDPVLVWRAAGRLGIGADAADQVVEAGLAEFGTGVRFRHPLVRLAAYRSASGQDRRQAHAALAEATDAMSILAGPGGSLREVAREVGKASSSRHVPRHPICS